MKKSLLSTLSTLAISAVIMLSACSSSPKRAMQVNTVYTACKSTLENANTAILSGNYDKAKIMLSQAQTQAISIDNYDLLISVNLTYVSLCLSMNIPDTEAAEDYLKAAQDFIPFSDDAEYNQALCTMSKLRIAIVNNSIELDFNSLTKELKEAQKAFNSEPYNQAQCQSILGDLYRIKNDYANAEKAYTEAAKQFTSERYLSEIGITWYKIAQNRSRSGNKKGALQALNQAIYYDRCAENSMALGSDYYIKAVILLKGNASDKEKEDAKAALIHSAGIFDAIGNVEMANRSMTLIEGEGL